MRHSCCFPEVTERVPKPKRKVNGDANFGSRAGNPAEVMFWPVSESYGKEMGNSKFDQELASIDQKVTEMFALVRSAIPAATDALLADDRQIAKAIMERDELLNDLYGEIELLIQHCFTVQAPVGHEMRYLLSMLRIVPELERSGDLVSHIARRASRQIGSAVSPRLRGLFEQAGSVAERLWVTAEAVHKNHDADLAGRLRNDDSELDDLHGAMIAEAIDAELPTAIAMEVALLARFYERLGDHAVNIANRLRYATIGVGARDHL
jgi:phosphate transport system protein